MKDIHFDEVSGDSSRPPDYPNHPNNNRKGLSLNPGILATVEEELVGFQSRHSPKHLEGSGAVKVPGVISDSGPRTTLRKSPIFSISVFLPLSTKTPNISITSILPRRYPRLPPKKSLMPFLHNFDTPITNNLSSNKKSKNTPLTKNIGISSLDHVTNNIGVSPLDHVSGMNKR